MFCYVNKYTAYFILKNKNLQLRSNTVNYWLNLGASGEMLDQKV